MENENADKRDTKFVRFRPCPNLGANHWRFSRKFAQTLSVPNPCHPAIPANSWICHGCGKINHKPEV